METANHIITFLNEIPFDIEEAVNLWKSYENQATVALNIDEPASLSETKSYKTKAEVSCGFADVENLSSLKKSCVKPHEQQHKIRKNETCNSINVYPKRLLSSSNLSKIRFFFLTPQNSTPCHVFSIKARKDNKKQGDSNQDFVNEQSDFISFDHSSESLSEVSSFILRHEKNPFKPVSSYEHLFSSDSSFCNWSCPNLENTEWKLGKHKKVMNFPGYSVSIIKFIRPSELKTNLNELFKERYPRVSITLSKIRSLENLIKEVAKECNLIEVFPLAKVYFERLIFQSFVKKFNRRHVAASCFLISAKVHGDLMAANVPNIISLLASKFNISKKELLHFEFPVVAALEFSLIHLRTC